MMLSALEQSNVMTWMSSGFNIYGAFDIVESTLQSRIFDPDKAPKRDVDTPPFGRLPVYLEWRPQTDGSAFSASGTGRDEFQQKFASRASVTVNVGAFTGHVEAAYGSSVSESSDFSFANYSSRFIAGNLVQTGDDPAYLSDRFKKAVAALPETADPAHLGVFLDFFQEFGAYFVTQITLGATLEYYKAVSHSTSMRTENIAVKAEASYKALFWSGKASAEMKSDSEWKTYRAEQHTRIRVKGGGNAEVNALLNIDANPKSDEDFALAKDLFGRWSSSIKDNPAVMDFRLRGIWEVCGAKRKVVYDTFLEYGKLMRPLMHIETKSYVDPNSGYTPIVFLNGRQVTPKVPPTIPNAGFGGIHMIVLDRMNPDVEGVKLSKIYNLPYPALDDAYRQLYRDMKRDLDPFRSQKVFLAISTYGFVNAFPPSSDFLPLLKEAGGGRMLDAWVDSVQRIGTSGITDYVNYIMVGIVGSGPSAAAEQFNKTSASPMGVISASLEVYFYSLGPGKAYVLGPAHTAHASAA